MTASCSTPRVPSPLCPQSLRPDSVQTLSQAFSVTSSLHSDGTFPRRKGGTQAFKHQCFLFHPKFISGVSQQFEDALILVTLKWK